jgi:hypothetical protein
MAELGAFFGNPNIQRQGARARALAGQRDVNTLADPRTYAIVQGLLGTAPDQMGISVLNPDYEKIRKAAEPAFALGLLGQAAPLLAPMTKGLPVGASVKNVGSDLFSYRGSHKAPSPDFGAPLHDLTGGGQMYPADVYSAKATQLYGTGYQKADKEAFDLAKRIRGNPNAEVTMYRAVPKDEKITKINEGDWVTLSKDYAKVHGESVLGNDYKIISEKVKAKELWTNADSIHEFGYHPQKSAPRQEALDKAQRNAVEYPLAPAGTRYEEFGGELTYMTPDEYLSRVRPLTLDDESLDNIAALKSHVQSGGQLDPLHIYQSGKEDGRHRAYMAKELGIERIPVALHSEANNLGQNIQLDALSLLAEQKRKEITSLLE